MANHHGAYMLNEVLCALEEEAFFTTLGPERTQQFIKRIVDLGYGGDCQSYEILDRIGPRLGICVMCSRRRDGLDDYGVCSDCQLP